MGKYKNLTVPNELHRRAKLLGFRLDIQLIDVVERAITLLEEQNELSRPTTDPLGLRGEPERQ